jgi:TonB-dependent siderophore receptor
MRVDLQGEFFVNRKYIAAAMGALLATVSMMVQVPAFAQSAVGARDYDIPGGPLGQALNQLGRTIGVAISYDQALVAGKITQGLHGSYSPEQALEILLRGVSLRAVSDGSGGFVVAAMPAEVKPASAILSARSARSIEMDADTAAVEEIVVSGYRATQQRSATKTLLALKETPQSVSVVTADMIADRGAQSLAEAMYFIPNVVAFNEGATGGAGGGGNSLGVEYNIRGIYESGQLNYRRINGLRTHNRGTIDMAALERVEVVRGPASMFGGAVPPGGIINLIPKRASKDFEGFATLRAGSYDARVLEGDVGGALNDDGTVRARVSGKYVDEGSWIDFRESELWVGTLALGADLTPTTSVDVTGSFQRREFVEGGSFAVGDDGWVPDIPRSRFVGIPVTPSEGELGWVDVELRQELAPDWSMTMRGRYEDGFNTQRATEFNGYIDRDSGLTSLNKLNRRYSFDTVAADAFVSGSVPVFGQMTDLLLGGDYFKNSESVAGGRTSNIAQLDIYNPDYGLDIGSFDGDLAKQEERSPGGTGIYGQMILRPDDRFALHLGGRYDWARLDISYPGTPTQKSRNEAFTGRASITWNVDEQLTAYATYNESFIPSSGTTREGDLVKPETGHQIEVGLKTSLFQDRLSASIAGYRMVRQDVATADPRNGTGEFFVIATGEQVHKGIELEITGQPIPGLQIVASLAYQDALVTRSNDGMQGTVPYDAQEFTGALLATYELQSGPLKGFGFGGSVRDLGKYYPYTWPQNLLAYNPPPIVDAQLFYRGLEDWDVRLNIFNLTDEHYLSAVSIYGASTFGRPRSAMLSVTRHF